MSIAMILKRLTREEKGATMVEYAIVVGFIAAVCAVMVSVFGRSVLGLFARFPQF